MKTSLEISIYTTVFIKHFTRMFETVDKLGETLVYCDEQARKASIEASKALCRFINVE